MINPVIKILYPFSGTWLDYPDNDSYSAYLSCIGCNHYCKGCHNTILHDYNLIPENLNLTIKTFTVKQLYAELYTFCYKNNTNKLVLGGADFLYEKNAAFTKLFIRSYGNLFDICLYTGDSIEQVKRKNILGFTYLKTGEYQEELKQEPMKTEHYFQLASTNQKIYNSIFNLCTRDGRMYF